jgi:hypothetical protein
MSPGGQDCPDQDGQPVNPVALLHILRGAGTAAMAHVPPGKCCRPNQLYRRPYSITSRAHV